MSQPSKSLSSVCEFIVDCEHKTAPTQDEGYPSIRTTNIARGWFDLAGVNRVSEDVYREWTRRAVPQPGDLILAREAPVGNVAVIPPGLKVCLGQRTVLLRPDQSQVNPRYLCYLLLGDSIQHRFAALSSGATVAHLNLRDIRGLELPELPPRAVQDRISDVLSAYDDLIENNTRRIAILEEMARALYREWFVHFRFPGHEQVEMVESELGPVPAGWEVAPVTDAVEFDPRTAVPREGEKPFVPMGSLATDSMLIENIQSRSGNSGSKFRNGDTLFARITPCLENGKTGFVQFLPAAESVAFGSTEFIVMRSKTLSPELVYLLARSDGFRGHAIQSMSGATGRQRVQRAAFESFQIAQPDDDTVCRFTDAVAPMFRAIRVLARQNRNLRHTRDLLLPRLISGEIEVGAAEEALAGVA